MIEMYGCFEHISIVPEFIRKSAGNHGIQWNHPEIYGSLGVLPGFPSFLNVKRGTALSEPPAPSSDGNSSALEHCRDRGAEDSVCFGGHEPAGYLTVCHVLVQKQKNPKV